MLALKKNESVVLRVGPRFAEFCREMIEERAKVGHFDWIVSYDDIREYFSDHYITRFSENSSILIVGCGTSTLGECLWEEFRCCKICSIDNDHECINHMKTVSNSPVEYLFYDLVELEKNPPDSPLNASELYDAVVDKGTFDAILVEGSIITLILEIVRLLKPNGSYLLFTINDIPFVTELLTGINLGLSLEFSKNLFSSVESSGNVLIFKKVNSPIVDREVFVEHERNVLNQRFQVNSAFLTAEFEDQIRKKFSEEIKVSDVDIQMAYHLMFDQMPELGYDYSLFLEDLQSFHLQHPERMNLSEILDFLKQMQ